VQGRAVQVDPIKPKLKPTGTGHLKLKYDKMLSRFTFKLNLRRYSTASGEDLNVLKTLGRAV
jgi:hypothetical protein